MQSSQPSSPPSPAPEQPTPSPTPAPKKGGRALLAILAVVVVIIVILAAAVLVGVFNAPAAPTGAIKLGFSISLTGSFNVEGTNSLNGIKAATQWINQNGGIVVNGTSYTLNLDYSDDGSLSTNVANLYPRLVTQDNAQFLLAPYSSGLTGTAAPFAEQYSLVMMSHGGASDSLWSKGYKNLVGVLSPASSYLRGSVDWIKANKATDKLAFLYADDAFSIVAGKAAVAYATSLGLTVVYNQSYPSTGTTSLATQLAAAKAAGADDLIGGGHLADGQLIMSELPSVPWTPKLISLLVAVTEPKFQQALGAAANNVTGPSQWETAVSYTPALATAGGYTWFGPTSAQFTQLYANVTGGATPTYHSGEAAQAVLVLAKAIETAKSLNTALVRAALGQMKLMTFFGAYQVASSGIQIAHTMVLDQWQAAVLKVVWPTAVAASTLQYPYTGT